jgi:hypothetical protein
MPLAYHSRAKEHSNTSVFSLLANSFSFLLEQSNKAEEVVIFQWTGFPSFICMDLQEFCYFAGGERRELLSFLKVCRHGVHFLVECKLLMLC